MLRFDDRERKAKVIYNLSGKSTITNRITIPNLWIIAMGIKEKPEAQRYVIISFDKEKKEIIVRKYKNDFITPREENRERKAKVIYNTSGYRNSEGKKSSFTNRITIPTSWIKDIGVKKEPEEQRYVIISFDREKKEITIRKYKHDRDV
ncbi:TPA: hypothetical protein ACKONX_002895 [Clostridioides difficile]|uniref:hypothetical protein n=1 Tax=Clostridioides difficile TaxID=1496 RepID=UPI00038C6691|nr:hypothetical protein [Clostridioides difficile]EQH27373.1 antidote-toxin recognition MazE family protein [Clostridioides difficile DA00212]MCD8633495.1 hypothetical protein [Clostridioides difficile]